MRIVINSHLFSIARFYGYVNTPIGAQSHWYATIRHMRRRLLFQLSIIVWLLVGIFIPGIAFGQTESGETFQARVIEVVDEQTVAGESGGEIVQQVLKLKALDGTWEGQEITFDGTRYEAVAQNTYAIDDVVQVAHVVGVEGDDQFYVVDYIRRGVLYWLAGLFALTVVAVGRLKGLRALVVLVLSFVVILGFIIPQIVDGASPLLISIVGTFGILVLAIYLTEGLNRPSTLAIASIFGTLVVTGLLAVWFTALTKLTGFASDDAIYLLGLGSGELNVRGLLLAGIIIGALGVLDDVAVSQTAVVGELRSVNPRISKRELYMRSMRVGVSHMSSMVNTLFFAYAGAALPLLILFSATDVNAPTFAEAINSEIIATEIVRTLVGSIGLVLMVPITTGIAVWFSGRYRHTPADVQPSG